jgi:hypothetical protein
LPRLYRRTIITLRIIKALLGKKRIHETPLLAAMKKRSERFSLRARLDAGDLVAGLVSGRSVFVGTFKLSRRCKRSI